jgi:hypothetical protein
VPCVCCHSQALCAGQGVQRTLLTLDLSATGGGIGNAAPLSQLTALRHLNLSWCTGVTAAGVRARGTRLYSCSIQFILHHHQNLAEHSCSTSVHDLAWLVHTPHACRLCDGPRPESGFISRILSLAIVSTLPTAMPVTTTACNLLNAAGGCMRPADHCSFEGL